MGNPAAILYAAPVLHFKMRTGIQLLCTIILEVKIVYTGMEYKEARDLLLNCTCPVSAEQIPLDEADGRILAQSVTAVLDVPPFDRSPYDGYAFRAEDSDKASRESPVTLRILEEIPAGSVWTHEVVSGTAAKILTGAPIPPGADAVTKYEDTEFSAESVTIFSPSKSGDNVVSRGEDVLQGQLLAQPGTPVDSALLGTLAAQGITNPSVYRVPVIGILSTGSELVEAGETLSCGKIVNTNRHTFAAAVRHAGCSVRNYGIVGDDPDAIAVLITKAIDECDMVISTGGVSVGDYDFTPDAMERSGVDLLIRSLKLKPGGASAYGMKNGRLICALSGNPASALVNFYAVVLPALRKLTGLSSPLLPELTVTLREDFRKRSPRTRLIRGRLELSDGTAVMSVDRGQGNGVLHSLIGCNLLAEIPAGSPKLPAGTKLQAYFIP